MCILAASSSYMMLTWHTTYNMPLQAHNLTFLEGVSKPGMVATCNLQEALLEYV